MVQGQTAQKIFAFDEGDVTRQPGHWTSTEIWNLAKARADNLKHNIFTSFGSRSEFSMVSFLSHRHQTCQSSLKLSIISAFPIWMSFMNGPQSKSWRTKRLLVRPGLPPRRHLQQRSHTKMTSDNISLQITYCGPLPLVSSEFTQPPFLWSGLTKNLPHTADIIADIIYAWPQSALRTWTIR